MAANLLFFCLHVNQPSLPNFHFKILLYFVHVDKAKRANYHVNKRIINWLSFWNKVYTGQEVEGIMSRIIASLSGRRNR